MDDEIESVLYVCREVMVYKVPPRSSNAGYRAEGWGDLSNPLWKGRMRILETSKCTIRLEDPSTVFAQSPYDVTGTAVEPVLDSSRYFVLRVEDSGKKAYIGIGFAERTEAFDFNVALQDYTKRQKATLNQEASDDSGEPKVSPHLPAVRKDFSLKEGQTLGSIAIPGGSAAATPPKKKQGGNLLGGGSSSGGVPLLPPPPSSKKR
ncbi:hypothetical protein FRB93_012979 [Tulasnella sp. JGI-2019a]|nr:hypothetical protein FRB93_012979 [Tulasnella sp. JGI-2019a]